MKNGKMGADEKNEFNMLEIDADSSSQDSCSARAQIRNSLLAYNKSEPPTAVLDTQCLQLPFLTELCSFHISLTAE
jgi:hypothetical protein